MDNKTFYNISGRFCGERRESRILEEMIQKAVEKGHRFIKVDALGQHGIGGRLWKSGDEKIYVRVEGHPGQRLGSLGFANTQIEVMGPVSDDVGWLNAGAEIIVHGNAANGVANAMAQGKIYIAGNIGSRGMTMTKKNPRFAPPEVWVLGSAGDYFGEFMAGGIAVICGVDPQTPDNVLGYRPLVGMVGGKLFFRGNYKGFSEGDAKQIPIDDESWQWLSDNLRVYLEKINRPELYEKLTVREEWQLIAARTPQEKKVKARRSMASFRADVWDKELGKGGLIGDLTDLDMSPIPLITTGDLRRFAPVWENRSYLAPCQDACPSGIPVPQRWQLIREGRIDEAVDMALAYTPFPATVCGYLCPNLCMNSCTRQDAFMVPVDIKKLGQASIKAKAPELPPLKGKKVAVIGGGPGGISAAWQLRQKGIEAVIYDNAEVLGGKMTSVIPESRIPKEILTTELERLREVLPHIHQQKALDRNNIERIREDYDFVVVATGAQKPRKLPVPGKERLITSLDFLLKAKEGKLDPGKKVIIIGAGNVGCDVATEAYRFGAGEVTLIDVQEPAAFGLEKEDAEKAGAKFRWPCYTKEITEEGVLLESGELLEADTVVVSIGDMPETEFLPESVAVANGYVCVNEHFQTTDEKIFAIGDIVKPGLLTDAIGAGREAAEAISEILDGKRPISDKQQVIDKDRVALEYFDPRITGFEDTDHCGSECSSCGNCRDCGVCVSVCPQGAISRVQKGEREFEYVVDADKCIGCGFCSGACPCGIWNLVPNTPVG